MAKIYGYTALMLGIMFLLSLSGIGGSSAILQFFAGWGDSFFSVRLLEILIAWGAIAGIAAGLFGRTVPESIVIAPLSVFLVSYSLTDMYLIYQEMHTQCGLGSVCEPFSWIILTLMGIFSGTYLVAMVQWWRGNDIA